MKVAPVYPHLISGLDRFYGISAPYRPESTSWTWTYDSTRSSRSQSRSHSTDRLRILLFTFWKYPTAGGLSSYLKALKLGLEKRGHRVEILHPESFHRREVRQANDLARAEVDRCLRGRYGDRVNPHIAASLRSMLSYEALLSERDLQKYDVFHAQDRFTANVVGRLNQSYRKPLFFTPHGFMTHKRLRLNLIKQGTDEAAYFSQIDRKAVEVADKVIMLSETFRPILTSLGADNGKLETIHTGIEFHAGSGKPKDERLVISCVSRLGPRKGHTVLLEALHKIRHQLSHVRIHIVGDGEMRGELERLSSKLHLSRVSFLGHRDDVASLLSKSDIYVLPTTSDTLPISVIEAMFAGKAIVTTRCGGIPELIRHQETGLLAEPGNVGQLADCLLRLIKDRPLIKQLGEKARQFAKDHLTVDKMADKIEHVYRSSYQSTYQPANRSTNRSANARR